MCHFITLIAPTDDTIALAAVMNRHGRGAKAVNNPSLAKILQPGDRQYLTTRKHCDCGTVLSRRAETGGEVKSDDGKDLDRMRRKGWSEARIARALGDKAAARARPTDKGSPELDQWTAILDDVAATLRLPHAGLFVHFYSGGIESEALTPTRRAVRSNEDRRTTLATMSEDELMVFRFA